MEANVNANASSGAGANLNYVERTIDEATFRIGQLQDLVKGLHLLREWGQTQTAFGINREREEEGSRKGRNAEGAGERGTQRSAEGKRGTRETVGVQTSGRGAVPNGIGKRVEGVIEELVGEFDARMVAAELPGERFESVRNAVSYLVKQGRLEGVPGKRGWFRPPQTKGKGRSAEGAEERTRTSTRTSTRTEGVYRRGKGFPKGESQERGAERKAQASLSTPNAGASAGASGEAEVAGWQDELEAACQARDGHRAAGREGLAEVEQKKVDRLVALIQGRKL